jgi:hypothetical protein
METNDNEIPGGENPARAHREARGCSDDVGFVVIMIETSGGVK